MPLGFDNNSTMVGIITRGGDYLTNQFTAIGQQVEQTLMRNRAMRETQAMGQELAQVNPATDDFPQVATLLASKYPLAMETGMGGKLLTLPSLAFKAFKETQQAEAMAGKAYTLEAMRQGGRNAATLMKESPKTRFLGVSGGVPPGVPAGIPAGVSNAFDQEVLPPLPEGGAQPDGGLMGEPPVPPRGRGLGDIMRGAFNSATGAAPAARIPSALEIQKDLEAENQAAVAAGRPPIYSEADQVREIARRQSILQRQASQDAIAARQRDMANLTMENRKVLAADREAEKSMEQARKDRIDAAKTLALQKDADFKLQQRELKRLEEEFAKVPPDSTRDLDVQRRAELRKQLDDQQKRTEEALRAKHGAEAAIQQILTGGGERVFDYDAQSGRLR